jgi:hypothetical protein
MKFLLASLKTIFSSENCFESWINFLFWLFLTLLCRFSLVYIPGQPNVVKTIRAYSKNTDLIFRTLKNIHLVTSLLESGEAWRAEEDD